jgi:hypothetical protein
MIDVFSCNRSACKQTSVFQIEIISFIITHRGEMRELIVKLFFFSYKYILVVNVGLTNAKLFSSYLSERYILHITNAFFFFSFSFLFLYIYIELNITLLVKEEREKKKVNMIIFCLKRILRFQSTIFFFYVE